MNKATQTDYAVTDKATKCLFCPILPALKDGDGYIL